MEEKNDSELTEVELGVFDTPNGSESDSSEGVAPAEEAVSTASVRGCLCTPCLPFLLQVALAASCTGSFLFGFNLSVFNTSISVIGQQMHWCRFGGIECSEYKIISSVLQSLVFLGAAIGAMSSGHFLGLGSRVLYLVSLVIIAVGICFSVAANHYVSLGLARLVVGVAVGIISVVIPNYLAEMTPRNKRGTYGVLHQLLITVGIFVGVLLGLPFQKIQIGFTSTPFNRVWWRVLLGFGLIPVVIGAIAFGFFFTFETPFFYINRNQTADARALLSRLLGPDVDVEVELKAIEEQVKRSREASAAGVGLRDAFRSSRYLRIIAICVVLAAGQQFSGINVFITNSNKLFRNAGLSDHLVTVMSTVLTLVNILMTFPPMWLIEKVGRKKLLLGGTLGMCVSVLIGSIMLSVAQNSTAATWVAIAGAIVFVCFFSATYGPVLWVYLFECFPSEIKEGACGLASASNWAAGIVMVFLAGYLSTRVAYALFAALNFALFIFIFFYMKETKGRVVGDSPYLVAPEAEHETRTRQFGRFSILPKVRWDFGAPVDSQP